VCDDGREQLGGLGWVDLKSGLADGEFELADIGNHGRLQTIAQPHPVGLGLSEHAPPHHLGARIGALLIELPQREIGGRLPGWEDLVSQIDWARRAGCGPYA
jgi:hypothetical protein